MLKRSFRQKRIVQVLSSAHRAESNGWTKRYNCTLFAATPAVIVEWGPSLECCGETDLNDAYLNIAILTVSKWYKTPFESQTTREQNEIMLSVFAYSVHSSTSSIKTKILEAGNLFSIRREGLVWEWSLSYLGYMKGHISLNITCCIWWNVFTSVKWKYETSIYCTVV